MDHYIHFLLQSRGVQADRRAFLRLEPKQGNRRVLQLEIGVAASVSRTFLFPPHYLTAFYSQTLFDGLIERFFPYA